jgi:hypothetical protein
MNTAVLLLVDDCIGDAANPSTVRSVVDAAPSSARTQAAFVRALLHEAARQRPCDRRAVALREQIEKKSGHASHKWSPLRPNDDSRRVLHGLPHQRLESSIAFKSALSRCNES